MLDLGCGTGLCGGWLQTLPGRLVGVDLSPAMVKQAETKGAYDALVVGDILDYLRAMADEGDARDFAWLIVAADVFVYLGDLLPVLTAAAAVLQHGCGLLAFTVEDCAGPTTVGSKNATAAGSARAGRLRYPCTRLDEHSGVPVPSFCGEESQAAQAQRARCEQQGLVLQSNGRFAHSRQHVVSAAREAGLLVALEEDVSAREEGGRPVPGRLYVLSRESLLQPSPLGGAIK